LTRTAYDLSFTAKVMKKARYPNVFKG